MTENMQVGVAKLFSDIANGVKGGE